MKLADIAIKYGALLIVDEDGRTYICKPGWPEIVEIEISRCGVEGHADDPK